MGRSPSGDENGLKRGPWTPEEDEKLVAYIKQHGHGSWRALPKLAGLNRCGKSCRLRWTNYLRPDIKRGKFSEEEEQTILTLHSILGNKWSVIASHLPGRTDNEIKNFWNTHLKKKLIQMGFDPITHMPRTDNILSSFHLLVLANLQKLLCLDLPPLEEPAARKQQAEALKMAKHQYLQHLLQLPPSPGASSFQPLQYDQNMSVPFAHLPNLEFYETLDDPTIEIAHRPDTAAVYGQTDASMWLPSSSSNVPPLPPPAETDLTAGRFGDLCSWASNAESASAPSAWSDLLVFEDSLFNEIDL